MKNRWVVLIFIVLLAIVLATIGKVIHERLEIREIESELLEIQSNDADKTNRNNKRIKPENRLPVADADDSADDLPTIDLTQSEIDKLYQRLEKEGLVVEHLSEREILYLSIVGVDWDLLTPEQQAEADKDYYESLGLKPPLPGYRYLWIDAETPRRDENGNPIMIKKGDIYIKVRYDEGFAPTLEQYQEYQSLEIELNKAIYNDANPKDIDEIKKKIDNLKSSARGKIPVGASSVGGENLSSTEMDLKIQQALDNAYKELGLSHLRSTN